MKGKIILLSALLLATSATFLFSCKKKSYTNSPQLTTLSSATISGHVYARLADTVGASSTQKAPTTTIIKAWIDTKDLLYYTDTAAAYARKYYTSSVGADGKYSFTVDVSQYKTGILHIEPVEFYYNQIKKAATPPYGIYTVNKKYTCDALLMVVEKNKKDSVDVVYTAN